MIYIKQFIFQLQYSLVRHCTDGVLRTQALVRRQWRSSVVNQTLSGIWSGKEDETPITIHFYAEAYQLLCVMFEILVISTLFFAQ